MIRLLAPHALILLALAGLVIIFHMFRPRYREATVPSLLLWQQVSEALALHSRWRRLVATLLLILQILIVVLFVWSLARPVLTTTSSASMYVHILDTSASMMATDVIPSRFARAKDDMAAMLRAHRGETVITPADQVPYIAYKGTDQRQALSVLEQLTPFAGTANWEHVGSLVQALGDDADSIVVWTDGTVDPESFARLRRIAGDRLTIEPVGTPTAHNVGITAFEARQVGANLQKYEVLLTVENFGTQSAWVELHVTTEHGAFLSETLLLAPGELVRKTFPYTVQGRDILTARLVTEDDFSPDNEAFIVIQPPHGTRVALIGVSDRFLEDGLRIFPQVSLEHRFLVTDDSAYQLIIYDRISAEGTSGNRLSIAPPVPEHRIIDDPVITWWDPTHPLTRYIDWGTLRIERAALLPTSEDTRVLVEANSGPILTLDETDEGHLIRLAFALDESDFVRRVAFPVFLSNLLQFVHPTGWQLIQEPTWAGREVVVPKEIIADLEYPDWHVVDPYGNVLSPHESGGTYRVIPRDSGLHAIVARDTLFPFVVDRPPRSESTLHPRVEIDHPATNLESNRESLSDQPIWRYALIVIIGLLFVEAWFFINRGRRPTVENTAPRSRRTTASPKGGALR